MDTHHLLSGVSIKKRVKFCRIKTFISTLLYRKLNIIDYQNIYVPVFSSKNSHRLSDKKNISTNIDTG